MISEDYKAKNIWIDLISKEEPDPKNFCDSIFTWVPFQNFWNPIPKVSELESGSVILFSDEDTDRLFF